MTTHQSVTSSTTAISTPPAWVRVLLGVVLILAGIFVLGDAALATIVSTIFIGYTAIVAGAFEIIHAFWTKGWGGFIWHIVLGILYIAFGWMVVSQPASGALILTFALGLTLVASGLVRIVWGFRHIGRTRLDHGPVRTIRMSGGRRYPGRMALDGPVGDRRVPRHRPHISRGGLVDLWLASFVRAA